MDTDPPKNVVSDNDVELPAVLGETDGSDGHILSHGIVPDLASTESSKASDVSMTDEELFARATRPAPIPGVNRWGIPDAADSDESSPQLKASL